MWRSHLLNMMFYSLGVSLIFSLYFKSERREQIRLFIKIWSGMMAVALILGWVMLILGDL